MGGDGSEAVLEVLAEGGGSDVMAHELMEGCGSGAAPPEIREMSPPMSEQGQA